MKNTHYDLYYRLFTAILSTAFQTHASMWGEYLYDKALTVERAYNHPISFRQGMVSRKQVKQYNCMNRHQGNLILLVYLTVKRENWSRDLWDVSLILYVQKPDIIICLNWSLILSTGHFFKPSFFFHSPFFSSSFSPSPFPYFPSFSLNYCFVFFFSPS